jgi:very-short-patch-repair endonuclease
VTDRSAFIVARLDDARKELLDLGLRNPLISFRRLTARGVQVVDERPEELFRLLATQGKAMYFDPAPERGGIDDEFAFVTQPDRITDLASEERFTDNRLQTPHPSAQLQKRLLNTYHIARTFVEEQGISVLYLALGMLNWFEADSSDEPRKAPLILIPVELERTSVESRFRVSHTGEDIVTNLSLQAKLKAEFRMELPEIPDDLEAEGVNTYFDAVLEAVSGRKRWHVDRDAVELGFFSFGKFLMYNDLDVRNWPDNNDPADHDVLCALLEDGFPGSDDRLDDDAFIDETLRPQDVHHVVDADSTQILALVDALGGHNLVIQGPPGTGKSQTITNLIAEAIGHRKSVLFVSEKMAALEVVKRRLDGLGLGEACLELHSHKTNKRSLLEELARTLNLGRPVIQEADGTYGRLETTRRRLNEYASAVNAPVGESGITPYRIYGKLLQLDERGVEWPTMAQPEMREWPAERFREIDAIVERIQAQLGQMGRPGEHPFFGCKVTALTPADRQAIAGTAEESGSLLETVRSMASTLSTETKLPESGSLADVRILVAAIRRAISAPPLEGVALRPEAWRAQRDTLWSLLDELERYQYLRERHDDVLIPEAWDQDVLQIRQALAAHGQKWYRMAIGDYRSARSRLAGLCRAGLPKMNEERVELADAILESCRLQASVAHGETMLRSLYGVQWNGTGSRVDVLRTIARWIEDVHDDIDRGSLPSELLDLLEGQPALSAHLPKLDQLDALASEAEASLSKLLDQLEVDLEIRCRGVRSVAHLDFADASDLIIAASTELDRLQEMIAYNHLCREAADAEVGFVIDLAESWPLAPDHLADATRYLYLNELLKAAHVERPILATFDGARHASDLDSFRKLDTSTFDLNRQRLAFGHWEALPRLGAAGQMGVLRHEMQKRRRHLPIRQLMLRAGDAVKALKPVFMMSPMSVATYLPPGSVTFDLVVFDEASQVKPVEAFGAIIRGGQTIVVGDSKQLPPTSFFDTVVSDEVDDSEEDYVQSTGDVESILGLFNAKGAPERMLRWHYRSRHDSLITVSNREFYDGRLVTFPSPENDGRELGLRYHLLRDTHYDRGGSRANLGEARAVVDAVMTHAKESPHRTLGVAAFSQAQADAIQNQLEMARRADPSCESFFSAHPFEPFFVKNLENVQGDERDVIYISIGYGRDQNGKLTMNFGPLNRDGGERRLNVLITRARRRCEVFTNLEPEDINLASTSARGVVALRRYLHFARTGKLDLPEVTDRDADSVFETEVAKAIRSFGYEVHHQVGSAGYFIDLGVIEPERPGRFLLGIECDGATYHRARSARDRDRIRQSVLEGLGWKLHRIWSTDWFQNPTRESRKVLEAIEAAKVRRPVEGTAVVPSPDPEPAIRREDTSAETKQSSAAPYRTASLPRKAVPVDGVHTESVHRLATLVRDVVKVESPVHIDEVYRRVLDSYGVRRLGTRIRERLELGVQVAQQKDWCASKGDFLHDPSQGEVPIRDRSGLDAASRRIQLVAPSELQAAIRAIVEHSIGISREDLASEVCSLLGFGRTTADMRAVIDSQIDDMISAGVVREAGGHLALG